MTDTEHAKSQPDQEAKDKAHAEDKIVTGLPLVLLTVALISAMFLVALVRVPRFSFTYTLSYEDNRTEQSSQPQSPESPINSTPSKTLAGMPAPTS